MSLAAHDFADLPIEARQASPDAAFNAAGVPATAHALLMQGLRLMGTLLAIAVVTVSVIGLRVVLWWPTFPH